MSNMTGHFRYMNDGSGEVDLSSKRESQFQKSMAYCVISILLFILAFIFRDPAIGFSFPGGEIGVIIVNFLIMATVLVLCIGQGNPCNQKRTNIHQPVSKA